MGLAYAAVLLVAGGCMALLDARWGLVLWRDRRRSLVVLVTGILFFLLWDIIAIALGFYHRGDSEAMSGLMLAPELPVEELAFITFLCYVTLVLHGLMGLAAARVGNIRRSSR
ncbi:lycopene cyclase domain-containing protein [Ornithinimicrobium ciconiae]|uniref:Lycopene cyclase domain-containing protein n=1 Tax=Ornithinimicrobium ciconiae TaxID=2594265 RepID=A0A516GER1_9MICO|nr:lycopene cyclase domain-containing protein [Ornithinimicrobium ciconiae]QDO90006.1 lycopene cyclase domain-containing protein [Ornithinimicrobium ciconiae]